MQAVPCEIPYYVSLVYSDASMYIRNYSEYTLLLNLCIKVKACYEVFGHLITSHMLS